MRYRDLIFDLDDTLIASFATYAATHQRIAREFDMRVPSTEELAVYLDTWEQTLRHIWPEDDVRPFMARYDELAGECRYPAVPGARDTLEQLRGRGHRLWVVTKRSRRRLSQRMAQAELPQSLFEDIYCVEEQPASKPDPRCFEPVWQAIGERRAEASVYVGDRLDDYRAADGADMRFVAVGTGPEGHRVFAGQVPDVDMLATVTDLPAWLQRHG